MKQTTRLIRAHDREQEREAQLRELADEAAQVSLSAMRLARLAVAAMKRAA